MELTGTVVKKPFAPASKSAHEAVWLITDKGEFKLEREQGNPFNDPEVEKLVGRRITGRGNVVGSVFRIHEWKPADEHSR